MKYRLFLGWLILPRRFDAWCPGCTRFNDGDHFARCTLFGRAHDEARDNSERWLGRVVSPAAHRNRTTAT